MYENILVVWLAPKSIMNVSTLKMLKNINNLIKQGIVFIT